MDEPRISVVIPTRNEEGSLGRVMDEVAAGLRDRDDYEVVVVDTDSTDRTRDIATSKGARVVSEPRRGYGRAYKTGFAAARGRLIAALDADLTYPGDRISSLADLVEREGVDFVSGSRMDALRPEAMSGMHRVGNAILNLTFRILFQVRIRDCQSGMWVFRRSLLDHLDLRSDGMAFSEEIKLETIRHGFRFREVAIDYRLRVGKKKIRSIRDATANLVFLFRKRFGWAAGTS